MALIQYLAIQTKASGVLSDSSSLAHISPWASVVSVEFLQDFSKLCIKQHLSLYIPSSLQEAVENNEVAPHSPFLQSGHALKPLLIRFTF